MRTKTKMIRMTLKILHSGLRRKVD